MTVSFWRRNVHQFDVYDLWLALCALIQLLYQHFPCGLKFLFCLISKKGSLRSWPVSTLLFCKMNNLEVTIHVILNLSRKTPPFIEFFATFYIKPYISTRVDHVYIVRILLVVYQFGFIIWMLLRWLIFVLHAIICIFIQIKYDYP